MIASPAVATCGIQISSSVSLSWMTHGGRRNRGFNRCPSSPGQVTSERASRSIFPRPTVSASEYHDARGLIGSGRFPLPCERGLDRGHRQVELICDLVDGRVGERVLGEDLGPYATNGGGR